jgi:hypothetical protein
MKMNNTIKHFAIFLFLSVILLGSVNAATFGVTAIGSTSYPTTTIGQTSQLGTTNTAQGTLSAQKIVIPAGGVTIKSVSIDWSTIGSGGQVRFAFYTDSSGNPSSLVSGSDTGAVNAVAGWQTITYSTPIYLNAGTYWLARQISNDQPKRYYATSGGPGRKRRTFTWGSFPSSFGTPDASDNLDESEYVTYVKIEGYAKATKATLPDNNARIQSVSFYVSPSALGNFRLAIYNGSSVPTNKLWESGSTVATAGQWNTVTIPPGTLTLNSGTYWLGWEWDSTSSGPSYTAGSSGDGNYMTQTYGSFISPWSGTSSSEKYSIYATYTTTSCTCPPGANNNWAISMADNCVLSTNCNLGTGTLSFTGTGTFTINAILTTSNFAAPTANSIIWITSIGRWY